MGQLKSLLWKEWRETRIFLWIGLGIFLGLPCVGGLENTFQSAHRFDIFASPWVFMFGGVFAMFVAVATTCRDLVIGIEEFWRSRPVGVVRWFLMKYAVGLAISVTVCVVPLVVEWMLGSRDSELTLALAWMPFLCAALYSVAFAAGCLIRRPAHAAMLALAGLLLIYFLPLVVPPLWIVNTMAMFDVGFRDGAVFIIVSFALGMAGIAVVMLALGIAAVRYRWRIDAGRRLMYGAVGAVLLIIFATAGYQLGTNLPVLQEVHLPDGETVANIRFDGQRGTVVTTQLVVDDLGRESIVIRLRSLDLTPAGIQLGEPRKVVGRLAGYYWNWAQKERVPRATPPGNPDVFYTASIDWWADNECWLGTYSLRADKSAVDYSEIKLWSGGPAEVRTPRIQASGDRLYVMGSQLATFDITNPTAPRLISCVAFSFHPRYGADATAFSLTLPGVPGLPAEGRLRAATQTPDDYYFPDDRVLCEDSDAGGSQVAAWRLSKLTDNVAVFQPIGQWKETFLEELFGAETVESMTLRDGLLYAVPWHHSAAKNFVTVFDLRGPHPLSPAGHFGAPGISAVCPLPDGRALIGGNQLWLVGPPPTRH
jgi:hypothetical protein